MKDSLLKQKLLNHFWAQGCFVQPEVDIYYTEGVSGSQKLITDVDVFALRPHPNLFFERVLGDCKTERGQSPINRALWLSGLMKFLNASSGLLLLRNSAIERDHKLAARELNILVLNEKDFEIYDSSIVYPSGSSSHGIESDLIKMLRLVSEKYPRLLSLLNFLYRDAFRLRNSGDLIRRGIGTLRQVARELDPNKIAHQALLFDAAAVIGIGIAECAGVLFHQYLHPEDKETLSESLKILLWGGRDNYNYNNTLRQKFLTRKPGESEVPSLELPEWNTFLQVVRTILERPSAAFAIPWLLRQAAMDCLAQRPPLAIATAQDLSALNQAMLVLEYVCKASNAPRDFRELLVNTLVHVQANLAEEGRQTGQSSELVRDEVQVPISVANSSPSAVPTDRMVGSGPEGGPELLPLDTYRPRDEQH